MISNLLSSRFSEVVGPMINQIAKRPRLPKPLALPGRLIPERLHSLILSRLLNRLLVIEREEGELDFLEGRSVRIKVCDAGISYLLSLEEGMIRELSVKDEADLTVSGTAYDFLLLLSGREDPDTLFFQRHLQMVGDTDLGVHLKNMLAALDPDSLPLPGSFQPMLQRCLSAYERFA